MNRRAVSLILLLALAVAAAALAARLLAPQRLSDARIARHFLAIAFGREHADGPGRHLAKWQGGIRYKVVRRAGGPDVAKAEAALHRQMRDLAGPDRPAGRPHHDRRQFHRRIDRRRPVRLAGAPGLSRAETARRARQILPALRRRMRY